MNERFRSCFITWFIIGFPIHESILTHDDCIIDKRNVKTTVQVHCSIRDGITSSINTTQMQPCGVTLFGDTQCLKILSIGFTSRLQWFLTNGTTLTVFGPVRLLSSMMVLLSCSTLDPPTNSYKYYFLKPFLC